MSSKTLGIKKLFKTSSSYRALGQQGVKREEQKDFLNQMKKNNNH